MLKISENRPDIDKKMYEIVITKYSFNNILFYPNKKLDRCGMCVPIETGSTISSDSFAIDGASL